MSMDNTSLSLLFYSDSQKALHLFYEPPLLLIKVRTTKFFIKKVNLIIITNEYIACLLKTTLISHLRFVGVNFGLINTHI